MTKVLGPRDRLLNARKLFESITLTDEIFDEAAKILEHELDEDDIPRVASELGFDHDDIDQLQSPEFTAALKDWAVSEVWNVFHRIAERFVGQEIRAYRVITAPPDWKPDPRRHPGTYWSFDEHAAEAHWGSYANGHVNWRMVAQLKFAQIDWVRTLVLNAMPSYTDENEIRIIEGTPVKILKYQRVR